MGWGGAKPHTAKLNFEEQARLSSGAGRKGTIMAKVLLGLGTNMGYRESNLQYAVESWTLMPDTKVISVSSIYETAPIGYDNQQNFYNAVLLIETELSPSAVLGACLGMEAGMGRRRQFENGPRVIDMDVLLYENVKLDNHELTLPHPRMMERRFVLEPLKELFPEGKVMGRYFNEELAAVQDQKLSATGLKIEIK